MEMYRKYQHLLEKWLFPAILLLYPFLTVNQGLDVADSTYSLTNFQYFGSMQGTWMVATFLSNAAGWVLTFLPFGKTLVGIKCYTTFVQSATALTVYFGLRKKAPAPLLFLGEFLALGLCWCPSTILYNYLTYCLMTAGVLLLYRGLTEAGGRRQALFFVAAGVCLGANVAVRMPNVVQAAFILAVWYGIALNSRRHDGNVAEVQTGDRQRDADGAGGRGGRQKGAGGHVPWRKLLGSTGWCLMGYVVGFGVPFLVICIRYGISAYPAMVRTMFAMTEQATDYKPTSMISGMFADYGKGLYWLAFALVCAAAAGLAFFARERLYGVGRYAQNGGGKGEKEAEVLSGGRAEKHNAHKITGVIIKAAYLLLLAVLLRFYWGRGMFHFRYYEYGNGSIYYPTVLLLLVTIAAAVWCLAGRKAEPEKKILAAFVLLQIFLTPLGSNNDLYPIVNNLFVAAPFLLWVLYDAMRDSIAWQRKNGRDMIATDRKPAAARRGAVYGFVWQAPVALLILFVMVQSIGSHTAFVFQDGIYGERRDTRVTMPKKAAGVCTNAENAALLEELSLFMEEEGLTGRALLTYGELPGLSYLLDMPPALSTGWPDLDSYRMAEYERDLAALWEEIEAGGEAPVIIVSSAVAAYLSDDGEAIGWFGVDTEKLAADEKLRILGEWIGAYGYTERFGNARYVVYCK
ncbi:MAG: hypothetical protein NC415_12025 [bacterium]|nr:hypothetical protein [bacterium]